MRRRRLADVIEGWTPVIRVVEGLLAAASLVAAVVSGFSTAYLAMHETSLAVEWFGWQLRPDNAALLTAFLVICFVWFASGAILGGSPPTERSERSSASER